MIWQFIINGLITGILYSLLAIGFALVYNTTRIFHIAATGIYVFAAYIVRENDKNGRPCLLDGHLMSTILIGEKFFVVDATSSFKRI